ncbi:MAG: 4Fe-4S binding protein [Butyrivibrio hungatei]|nr:4Fe-4S binding protein [Butyrivibrio hungatei]
MVRKIIKIDEEKCNGCGICANACHEGAIDIVNGKAKLVRENFCDGFGDCLPGCHMGAISFEEREAPAYDEAAVKAAQEKKGLDKDMHQCENKMMNEMEQHAAGHGCPGSKFMTLKRSNQEDNDPSQDMISRMSSHPSRLMQWPCQIKLLPTQADFYNGAKLLIAADCTAYAYANMHEEFMKGKVTMIGCPKLDEGDYTEKLTEIITNNDIVSVTIVRMEVPCCGGLQRAAENAIKNSGKFLPWQVVTISRDGEVLD